MIFEITASGAIFSYLFTQIIISGNLPKFCNFIGIYAFLLPLIIVIPCIKIIYDKGITANRIAGFIKVIEETSFKDIKCRYLGWENGCSEFRRRAKTELIATRYSIGTQSPNRFYQIIYFISLSFALACISTFSYLFFTKIAQFNKEYAAEYFIYLATLLFVGYQFYKSYTELSRILKEEYTISAMSNLWWRILVPRDYPCPWD